MLWLDYETKSEAELGGASGVGLYNYATHPSTSVLLLAWAVDDGDPEVWFPGEPLPEELKRRLEDPNESIAAYNSQFERTITKFHLGYDIPVSRFQDPQASARYLSLPAALEDVGPILGLPEPMRKDKRGESLLDLFSFPKKRKKKEGGGLYFNDQQTHPQEWIELANYAKQDIVAEREIARRLKLLGVFPLPSRERAIWLLDQKINDRGMPTDMQFVVNLFSVADRSKKEKLAEQNQATGLDNANSTDQLMPWAQDRGYPLNNLRKQNIELVLKDPQVEMTEECRNVLEARMEASSTSYKKLQAILRNVSKDGRLRFQFIYMGSSRCGRWSGNAVQLHNMARPDGTFEDGDNVATARKLVYGLEYDALSNSFRDEKKNKNYSPLIIAKNLIRTVFVAPPGMRFNVCDLNAIETRVGAWVAQCESLLKVFKTYLCIDHPEAEYDVPGKCPTCGRKLDRKDPYLDFAVKMTGIPYAKLARDIKSKDKTLKAEAKRLRQMAKPGVLGAIYRLSGGMWGRDKNKDKIKTGLWGYAEGMGIDLSQEQSAQVVKIFRESYPEICGTGRDGSIKGIWIVLEEAVADVLKGERTVRYVGPDNCIKIDKLTVKGRDPILRILLPSGRYLHYLDASMQEVMMPWKRKKTLESGEVIEEHDFKESFTYYGQNQDTKNWEMIVSHGGKIFENIVQAIARDILTEGMLKIEKTGIDICGHVHDEIIGLTIDDPFSPGAEQMEDLMSRPVEWAKTLPLAADGWEDYFYHK